MNRLTAVRLVTERLAAGFEPIIGAGGRRRWARINGDGRIEEHGYTPAEGVVLDQLVFLQTDTGAGRRHPHRLHGETHWHRHEGAFRPHRHHPEGGSPDTREPRGAQP